MPAEWECAHIVPRHIGEQLEISSTNTIYNCMPLAKSLHGGFDNLDWTFDVYSFLDAELYMDEDTLPLRIMCKQELLPGSSIVNAYINDTIYLPARYLPSLWLRYYCFLYRNYTQCPTELECYRHFYHSPQYQAILACPSRLSDYHALFMSWQGDHKSCHVLIDHRRSHDDYLMLWDYYPHTEASWESIDSLEHGYNSLVFHRSKFGHFRFTATATATSASTSACVSASKLFSQE